MTRQRNDSVLRLIAVFKFFKAGLLLAAGLGALSLVKPSVAAEFLAWADDLAAVIRNEAVGRAVAQVIGLSPHRLHTLGIIAFLYVGLFVVEGTGLWLGRRWAEYLTVIATFSLIPFEIYELVRRVTLARFGALAINMAVLVYLIYRLRRDRSYTEAEPRPHLA